MTDKMKVYTKVLKNLKQQMPNATQHQIVVLAMMVAGIVLGQKAQLSKISLQIPSGSKPSSLVERFRRFTQNERVDVKATYLPFAEQVISHLSQHRLFIAMDGSQVGRGCMTLMVAVIYKRRAIPLLWVVYKGKKGHTTAKRHISVLQLLATRIPEGAEVVLLGDAEYDTVEMLAWVTTHTNWTFVVRSSPQLKLTDNEHRYSFRHLRPSHGGRSVANDVLFTLKMFGPVTAVAWWDKSVYKKPIYLISNLSDGLQICLCYAKRFKIETLFSDSKSRGFHIHKSHISKPERVNRLLLAVVLAYIWMVYLGVAIVATPWRRSLVDRVDRTDKSLFHLGLDWFDYTLTHGIDVDVLFQPPRLLSFPVVVNP